MAINFPASPSTNDTHTENAITWIFNGTSWNAQGDQVTAASIGLGNVDNTADANKPVSTATQIALDDKQDILAEGAFVDGDKASLDDLAGLTKLDAKPSSSEKDSRIYKDDQRRQLMFSKGTSGGSTARTGFTVGVVDEATGSRVLNMGTWDYNSGGNSIDFKGTRAGSTKTISQTFVGGGDTLWYYTNDFRGDTVFKAGVDLSAATITGLFKTEKWVVTADSHAWHSSKGGVQRFRDLCKQIGDHRPALVVHAGDLIDPHGDSSTVDYDTIKKYQRTSGAPWLHTLGNHEISVNGDDTDGLMDTRSQTFLLGVENDFVDNTYELNTETLLADRAETLGYYAQYSEDSGCWHVVLNSARYLDSTPTTGGYYWSTDQRDWLQAFLNGLNSSDRVMVYSHHPLYSCPTNQPVSNQWRPAEKLELHNMLEGFAGKVLCVVSGHRHTSAHAKEDSINYLELRNAQSGNATKSAAYGSTNSSSLSFSVFAWDESNSTLTITGYNGEASRSFVI